MLLTRQTRVSSHFQRKCADYECLKDCESSKNGAIRISQKQGLRKRSGAIRISQNLPNHKYRLSLHKETFVLLTCQTRVSSHFQRKCANYKCLKDCESSKNGAIRISQNLPNHKYRLSLLKETFVLLHKKGRRFLSFFLNISSNINHLHI